MRIRMKEKQKGSLTGKDVKEFVKGEVYDSEEGEITKSLCHVFIDNDWAEQVNSAVSPEVQRQPLPPETKELEEDPEDPEVDSQLNKETILGMSKEELMVLARSHDIDFNDRIGQEKLAERVIEQLFPEEE